MSKKSNQEFREEFIKYVNGYFNVPNYLSDIIQPHIKSSTWNVFTAIWRTTIGRLTWKRKVSISFLHQMTGLSAPTIIEGLNILQEIDLIIVERKLIGYGKQSGQGKQKDIVEKYGGIASEITINQAALKNLKWLENGPLKNLYRYHLKNFNGSGVEALKNLYTLKTINKNIKNREDFSIPNKKQKEESQKEGAKVLRDFLSKIGKDLNKNSENVSLFDTKEQEDESGENDSVSKEISEKGQS